MNEQKLNEAANEHAKEILGEDQFKKNKDAVQSIAEDFKAGAKWVLAQEDAKNQ